MKLEIKKYSDLKFGKNYFGQERFYKIECNNDNLYNNIFQTKEDRKNGKLSIPNAFFNNMTFVEKEEDFIYVKSKLSLNIFSLALLSPLLIILYFVFSFGLKAEIYIASVLLFVFYLVPVLQLTLEQEHLRVENYIKSILYEIIQRNK